jgi:hypothetical protein
VAARQGHRVLVHGHGQVLGSCPAVVPEPCQRELGPQAHGGARGKHRIPRRGVGEPRSTAGSRPRPDPTGASPLRAPRACSCRPCCARRQQRRCGSHQGGGRKEHRSWGLLITALRQRIDSTLLSCEQR